MRLINQLLAFILGYSFIITAYSQGNAQLQDGINDYLGYSKPGSTPEIFSPDFISTEYAEFAGTFSPDFQEYYFTRRGPFPQGIAQIMVSKKEGNSWSEPMVAVFSSNNYEFEPTITPDGETLYFGSRRSPDGIIPPGQMHQWFLEKEGNEWGDPILLGSPFFETMVMYPSVANDKSFYYTGTDGIYCSEFINGSYQDPVKLGTEINFLPLTAHSFIAPDESYMIFDGQPRGEGKSDLYITYKTQDGSWTKGKYMGKGINSAESQAIASVSPDGQCLFFTRDQDIYWVDAAIIEEIRLIPQMSFSPDSGTVPLQVQFNLDINTVPDSLIAFEWDFDNDGETDSYEQNPQYTYNQSGTYSTQLKVFSLGNDSAVKLYKDFILVKEDTSGFGMSEPVKKSIQHKLFQNYPNPFRDNTIISYCISESTEVKISVLEMNGSEIETLIDGFHKAGDYKCRFTGEELASGPYLYKLTTSNSSHTSVMIKK